MTNAAAGRVLFWRKLLLVSACVALVATLACKSSSNTTANAASSSSQPEATYQPNAAELDPPKNAPAAPKVDGLRAFEFTKEYVAIGPRPLGSAGHQKAMDFIISHLKSAGATVDLDSFQADTAAGKFPATNIIGRIEGKKDGIIVIAGHYETNLPTSADMKKLAGKPFVGANDGGSSTGLMLELATTLAKQKGADGKIDGNSVWLLFTDAEEATVAWSDQDSLYGSKHLAAKWKQEGTTQKVKALLLLDMIGDKDLNILRETSYSAPWLEDVIQRASQRLGTQSHFFSTSGGVEDDHKPFAATGIPVADIIDFEYGFENVFHHSSEDTIDKLSPQSLQIVGDVVLEAIRALNQMK